MITEDLVVAAQRGDEAAMREIYRTLAPAVRGYLAGRGAQDPDGLTSDVFIGLLERLPRLHGGADGLRRLTFTIAHARLVDELRGRARRPEVLGYEPSSDLRTVEGADVDAATSLGTERVYAVLSVLAEDQREVLLLRVVADLTIEQTAEVMQRSPGAVKQLQRRALLAVRAAIAERRVTL